MIKLKVKELWSELTYMDGDWEVSTTLEEELNKFLEENKDIRVIDIKYAMTTIDNEYTQSSALVIYEENPRKPFERK